MPILVYNTLTKRKEELIPAKPNWIRMYVCGPTTYNLIHLGNARPLVVFDTIRRYLVYRGYRVTFVQNFTDVDDKIINRAREEGQTWREVAERYIREFWRDAASLGVQVPDTTPRASEHIPEMIELISLLVEKGYAYVSSGDVYFEVSSFPSYGQLS
ncbi:MAG: class I tRNA ligase family protein, partial [Clostridia bacterium]|nr:class I tRNA ligase family protein [Clostridia bacterium]